MSEIRYSSEPGNGRNRTEGVSILRPRHRGVSLGQKPHHSPPFPTYLELGTHNEYGCWLELNAKEGEKISCPSFFDGENPDDKG